MVYLLSLVFIMVLLAFYSLGALEGDSDRVNHYRALAQQMVNYHAASSRVCGTTCDPGSIDPTQELATFRRNHGPYVVGSTFRSVAQNDYVITYYAEPNDDESRRQANAAVLAALMSMRSQETHSGVASYDQNAGALSFKTKSYWRNPETGDVEETNVFSPDVGALPAPDGAPVLVNRYR